LIPIWFFVGSSPGGTSPIIVKVAAPEFTLPAALLTATRYFSPLFAEVVAGVV
jgi:hypothetical protein